MSVLSVVARTIYDSRGQPTVECDLKTELGVYRAAVPSGASTGIHEAHELRDGGQEWNGLGVTRAVANINDIIAPAIAVSTTVAVLTSRMPDSWYVRGKTQEGRIS